MSVKKSTHRDQVPNWIDHDWNPERRLEWARVIMASSPRSWGQYPHATPGADDPETWALWVLVTCESRAEALASWNLFCFPNDPERDERVA